jgi:hypothetical protein
MDVELPRWLLLIVTGYGIGLAFGGEGGCAAGHEMVKPSNCGTGAAINT